ncbi:MAG: carbamoyl-phosphate synthase large subunit [Bacteroidales bacterium]|nr:carbamoyl-phosphate synthase large subunit [Bacteroidales bacterium]
MKDATLILSDGTQFHGKSFGYEQDVVGEVVFNTAMTGYPESLTDPSYAGQILVSTYPLIGNYGVPPTTADNGLPTYLESERIHVRALIVADYSDHYSHWNGQESLSQWLRREKIPAITGIDTRRLTKVLRYQGVMMGRIVIEGATPAPIENGKEKEDAYGSVNWVEKVSCKKVMTYLPEAYPQSIPNKRGRNTALHKTAHRVILVDCGVKSNIIRCLLRRGLEVVRVPWDYDFNQLAFDGLFLANGPGDPERCECTVNHIRTFLRGEETKALHGGKVRPLMGICLGNQLLAKAAGACTYKLKFGHRSHNQPVRRVGTYQCFITSQNHGYAVDDSTLPEDWSPLFVNMNDGSNEGICHKHYPWFSAQFHPEACSGPTDTEWMFDKFAALLSGTISYPAAMADETVVTPRWLDGCKANPSVLLLGSGALKIGQAGEFDYSGSQALKALKEEGVRTILINPNIATVQTSKDVADTVYFQPVTPEIVARIIEKERPDGILLSFGGQTALNCGVELHRQGVLQRFGVRVLGTPVETIIDTEDRERFVQRLDEIDVKTIRSQACSSVAEVREAAAALGFPVILRAAYALGGLGSGFCDDNDQLIAQAEEAFSFSPQVLVEKSLRGWKEVEYEVVRDQYDNCITVCNMENFDPLGIHTGESIVVAPSQTLTNAEYHKLRALAIRIVRHLGIVGECNVQYALDPQSEDYRIIEVNARLSRSSALASKATGYPLAFVAAKLGLGYGLFDLKNAVTKSTSAFFEPALDYVVCKLPRWDLSKFHGVSHQLGSSMKSVGEVMAIGRTFEESLQKGLRMIGQGMHGFVANRDITVDDVSAALSHATDSRIFILSKALRMGFTVPQIHALTNIDPWFLHKLQHIITLEQQLRQFATFSEMADWMDYSELLEYLEAPEFVGLLRRAKVYGFSDFQIARALGLETGRTMEEASNIVRTWRKELGVTPTVNQIDTLAAEYPAQTNYLYLTYV